MLVALRPGGEIEEECQSSSLAQLNRRFTVVRRVMGEMFRTASERRADIGRATLLARLSEPLFRISCPSCFVYPRF